eukprot:scaffold6899_cov183-Amphora_coffeaeformis.AAC.13
MKTTFGAIIALVTMITVVKAVPAVPSWEDRTLEQQEQEPSKYLRTPTNAYQAPPGASASARNEAVERASVSASAAAEASASAGASAGSLGVALVSCPASLGWTGVGMDASSTLAAAAYNIDLLGSSPKLAAYIASQVPERSIFAASSVEFVSAETIGCLGAAAGLSGAAMCKAVGIQDSMAVSASQSLSLSTSQSMAASVTGGSILCGSQEPFANAVAGLPSLSISCTAMCVEQCGLRDVGLSASAMVCLDCCVHYCDTFMFDPSMLLSLLSKKATNATAAATNEGDEQIPQNEYVKVPIEKLTTVSVLELMKNHLEQIKDDLVKKKDDKHNAAVKPTSTTTELPKKTPIQKPLGATKYQRVKDP